MNVCVHVYMSEILLYLCNLKKIIATSQLKNCENGIK